MPLSSRQDFRFDLGNAKLPRHGFGGRAIVAGEHHHPDARFPQRANGAGGRRLDRVGDGDRAARLAVDCGEDRRRAVVAQFVRLPFKRRDVNSGCLHHGPIAENHFAPVDGPGHALARRRVEVFDFAKHEIAVRRRAHHRRGQRMLACPFEARGKPEQLVFAEAADGPHGDDPGSAFGQCAGLVDDERVDPFKPLQSLGVLDQAPRPARRARRRP